MTHFLRSVGPAVPHASPKEAVRAGLGALLGLLMAGLFLLAPSVDDRLGLYLIAPFGATSVLVFAAPNSPLAQPWSAIMGNLASALMGIAACMLIPDPVLRVAVAVGAAITAMILIRALHPPGGAVAMTAALNPDATLELGWSFAFAPVACGTLALILIAVIYARITGRRYPFRQFEEKNPHGTGDLNPLKRIGLNENELVSILERYNQTMNLGVADLARLIGAAEMVIASHRGTGSTAADIMSRDLITVGPDAPLFEVAELFRRHAFTSLPVVGDGNEFHGVIFQLHLIRHADERAQRRVGGFLSAMGRLIGHGSGARARDVMDVRIPRAAPETPVSALLPLMSDGHCDAVPVLDGTRIVGIVTRTDIIAALAHQSVQRA
ncbi:HPP family protein [Paracoccus onubensis]|uniref:CBS domain-containing protein n=1 Tax=Paracoccus onubensis TaxID=1675788 RepID=A0A418T7W9_9RHOB|nr:HPP family protein [Paracoccus onubensis]RJE89196.1 CBS domain-containing protein [Paracoccus onubensis]